MEAKGGLRFVGSNPRLNTNNETKRSRECPRISSPESMVQCFLRKQVGEGRTLAARRGEYQDHGILSPMGHSPWICEDSMLLRIRLQAICLGDGLHAKPLRNRNVKRHEARIEDFYTTCTVVAVLRVRQTILITEEMQFIWLLCISNSNGAPQI